MPQQPSLSLDLNPIRNLWDKLKGNNLSQIIWKIVQDIWYLILTEKYQKIFDSVTNKINAVIKNCGFTTKY